MSNWLTQEHRGPRGHDVMQVCANGHKITELWQSHPEYRQDFCAKCGAATTTKCAGCETPIQGHNHDSAVISTRGRTIPKYCTKCGRAFLWQVAALENLEGVLKESGLSDSDLKEMTTALPDVVHDTPKTQLASMKFKRILGGLKKPAYDIAVKVVTDIASETAKKVMGF
jgi:hypothetical protein